MRRCAHLDRVRVSLIIALAVSASACQLATALPDLKLRLDDGSACDRDGQCESGRCVSGICCATGCDGDEWAIQLGGNGRQSVNGLAVDDEGAAIVAGIFSNEMTSDNSNEISLMSAGDADAFIAKLDGSGQHLWSHAHGASGDQRALYVSTTATDIYVAGEYAGPVSFEPYAPRGDQPKLESPTSTDTYVVKLTRDGESVLALSIGGGDPMETAGVGVALGFGVVVLASFVGTITTPPTSSPANPSALLSRFTPSGDPTSVVQFGDGAQPVRGTAVAAASALGYVVACSVEGDLTHMTGSYPSLGGTDLFVLRKPADGGAEYVKRFGGPGDDIATDMATIDEHVVIVGELSDTAAFGRFTVDGAASDLFVVRLDDSGEPVFASALGAPEAFGAHVAAADDGTLWVAANVSAQAEVGNRTHPPIGTQDVLLLKLKGDGSVEDSWRLGGSGKATVQDMGVDENGRLFLVGSFDDVIEIAGRQLESHGDEDGFIARLAL